jgi:hypothetical protein
MTAPLTTDGLGWPCKGYINNPSGSPYMDSVVSWKAGDSVTAKFAGTASHLGGSCQFSMSYDEGKTWNGSYFFISFVDKEIGKLMTSDHRSDSFAFGWMYDGVSFYGRYHPLLRSFRFCALRLDLVQPCRLVSPTSLLSLDWKGLNLSFSRTDR